MVRACEKRGVVETPVAGGAALLAGSDGSVPVAPRALIPPMHAGRHHSFNPLIV